jgi:hypothetical protein
MKKNRLLKFAILASAALFLTFGCGGKNTNAPMFERQAAKAGYADDVAVIWEEAGYSPDRSFSVEAPVAMPYMEISNAYGGASGGNVTVPETSPEENAERKIVRQATVRIRVENLDAADNDIGGLMEKLGAYAASTMIDENSHYYTIRVPSTHYDAFLAATDGMGRMLNRSESAEDVSLRYYDLEGRLATKKEQ